MRHIFPIAASVGFVLLGGGFGLSACGSSAGDDLFGGASGVTTGTGETTGGPGATSTGSTATATSTGSGMGGAGPTSSTNTSTSSGIDTSSSSSAPTSSSVGTGGNGQGGASMTSSTGADMSASVTASASTGGPPGDVGCSDGTREAYVDTMQDPKIAGCAGSFLVAGVTTPQSFAPQCNRQSGNDGVNQTGMGCSVEDLCAAGWHVCKGAAEVMTAASTGECDPPVNGADQVFWLTRQGEDMNGTCGILGGPNNITGCGSFGEAVQPAQTCTPLTHFMKASDCGPSATWFCGNQQQQANPILNEGDIVFHQGNNEGGVLCCKG